MSFLSRPYAAPNEIPPCGSVPGFTPNFSIIGGSILGSIKSKSRRGIGGISKSRGRLFSK